MIKKKGRVNIHIDMTPMVDVVMLLLTFFMLTATFRAPEAAVVELPSSHSAFKLPESDMMTVTITKDGKLFLSLDSQVLRARIFGEENQLRMGVEVENRTVLADMMIRARMANLKLRTVVKGDKDVPFGQIQDVIDTLQKVKITRFSLVTELDKT